MGHTWKVAKMAFQSIIFLLGAYWVLGMLGFSPDVLLLTTGLTFLGVSYAIAPILLDLFTPWPIQRKEVVYPGQLVEIDGVRGVVDEIGSFDVVLRDVKDDSKRIVDKTRFVGAVALDVSS